MRFVVVCANAGDAMSTQARAISVFLAMDASLLLILIPKVRSSKTCWTLPKCDDLMKFLFESLSGLADSLP